MTKSVCFSHNVGFVPKTLLFNLILLTVPQNDNFECKMTLEIMFQAKTGVSNAARNDVSIPRYAHSFKLLQLHTCTSGFKYIPVGT